MKRSILAICMLVLFIGMVATPAMAVGTYLQGVVKKWEYKPATEEENGYFEFWPIFVRVGAGTGQIYTIKSGPQQIPTCEESHITWFWQFRHFICCMIW
jgi:hypothetical protein